MRRYEPPPIVIACLPGFERQREVTDQVLAEIGAGEVPRIRVFNKIDHVGDTAAQAEREAALRGQYLDCIVMSARRRRRFAARSDRRVLPAESGRAELFLPWSAQQVRGEIFATCEGCWRSAPEPRARSCAFAAKARS